MDASRQSILMGAALGLLAIFALRSLKTGEAFTVTNAVASVTESAIDLAGDAAAGVVLGVGDAVGVPRTDEMLCSIAKANGDALGASKYCTAGDFLAWTMQGQPTGAEKPAAPAPAQPSAPDDYWLIGSD